MKALDTNVLIRYLVQDDPKQTEIATRFIETQCTVDSPCFIGQIVLCEIVWVLSKSYAQDRAAISHVIEQLLQVSQFKIQDTAIAWRALNDYKISNADFADHLLARINAVVGCESTVTLDKKAAKCPGFELLTVG